jgi:predicted nuclease of predicted toxin-antitoxin system
VRVLLDEQLPRQLALYLTGHDVRTVKDEGWKGLKNGELLLRTASAGFEALVTGDQNLEFQQNLSKLPFGVVALSAVSNALEDLLPLVPGTLEALNVVQPGQILHVRLPSTRGSKG